MGMQQTERETFQRKLRAIFAIFGEKVVQESNLRTLSSMMFTHVQCPRSTLGIVTDGINWSFIENSPSMIKLDRKFEFGVNKVPNRDSLQVASTIASAVASDRMNQLKGPY